MRFRQLAALLLTTAAAFSLSTCANSAGLDTGHTAAAPSAPLTPSVTHYDFRVGLTRLAPDCYERTYITVNGEYNAAIEVVQGNILEVVVYNNLPPDWPAVSEGISIHWHGWSMVGAEWYDGVGYLAMCPITPGTNFTYRFQVNEEPGTYFWHGHSGMEKVDGFFGPLIVRPRGPEPLQYDEERILLLDDNYHEAAGPLSFRLNRPFDKKKATPSTGAWDWVAVPQSIMLNGHAFYGDCALLDGDNTAVAPKCSVTHQWLPPGRSSVLPFAPATNPGCSRYNMTVEAGKTYRVRMINAASLAFLSVCFAGHGVTVVAADAYPVEPLPVQCVNINLGQRYDVLLKADQPVGNYWLSAVVVNGTRTGSPAGYGVLRYAGADNSSLPEQPLPQPEGVAPWNLSTYQKVVMPEAFLSARTLPAGTVIPQNASDLAMPPFNAHLLINLTQPLLPSGQLRWALNNVATYGTPACLPTLAQLKSDPSFMTRMASQTQLNAVPDFDMQQNGSAYQVRLFMEGNPVPTQPVAGQEFMALTKGDVVQVLLQNLAADANGGDYRPGGVGANRTAQEQHPFHLHGHHFWLLGQGMGVYNDTTDASQLNTANPPFRDSFTIFKGGWVVLRFKADNPGLWILHCHTDWHLFMGQKMYFATSPALANAPPSDLPQCPSSCMYNFGAFEPGYVASKWGNTGYST